MAATSEGKKILFLIFGNGACMAEVERFTLIDFAQISVGSFVGALSYVWTSEIWKVAEQIPAVNVAAIALLSVFISFIISYEMGVRRLGHKKMKMLFGFMPVRVFIHYSSALFFSALMLFLLALIDFSTPWNVSIKMIVVLALPATVIGSAVDLLGSQKSK